MLIQLTLQNFLSFRDEVTFSMLGVNSDQQHLEHLTNNAAGKDRSLLPIAAIYGANAAGKSNLIEAVKFAKDLVVEGTRSTQSIPVIPFKLGNYKKSSRFECIFTYQGIQYSYGFKLNREQIFEEWLYGIPYDKKQEIMYFERITSSKKETSLDYGTPLKGRSNKRKQFLDFVAEGTRPNQLFLTEAIDRNVDVLVPVANWFREALTIIPAEADYPGLEIGILSDESFIDFISEFLRFAGTGIDSISTEEVELDIDYHFPNMPKIVIDDLIQELNQADREALAIIGSNSRGKRDLIRKNKDGKLELIQLKTQHRNDNGNLIDFTIEEESEGTQRLLNLIPILFLLKQEPEKVIFLDELDRRLHPLLSHFFVQTAINCREKSNQLIFTTHDTNLLDLDLLRRDEIWFVEKNQQGASSLYSLAEFKIRPDLKVEKGYLNGRFGAIPFFGDPQRLGWFDCETDLSV